MFMEISDEIAIGGIPTTKVRNLIEFELPRTLQLGGDKIHNLVQVVCVITHDTK